eukprot:5874679-Amphidinium_carterae.1
MQPYPCLGGLHHQHHEGTYTKYMAAAIGSAQEGATSMLQEQYTKDIAHTQAHSQGLNQLSTRLGGEGEKRRSPSLPSTCTSVLCNCSFQYLAAALSEPYRAVQDMSLEAATEVALT